MPNLSPKCRHRRPELPFPEPGSHQKRQIKPQPQLAPAQGEGAVEPGEKQLQCDQQLAKPGRFSVEWAEYIGGSAQQHTLQKAPRQPLPDDLRGHRRHPRRSRGSS
jgi:hypothetical protein